MDFLSKTHLVTKNQLQLTVIGVLTNDIIFYNNEP